MALTRYLKHSFGSGEITPELFGRVDAAPNQTGLALCENAIVLPYGPAQKRPGTLFVAEVKDSTKAVRLIPFSYNNAQTFAIEVGAGYFRFHTQGATLLVGTPAAYNATTTYTQGQLVSYSGTNYVSLINANTGNQPDTSPTDWYAQPTNGYYELPNTYAETDLFSIRYAQSADVLTLTHPTYAVLELTRLGASEWGTSNPSFEPAASSAASLTATAHSAGGTNTTTQTYAVTDLDADDNESYPSASASCVNDLTAAGAYNTITWTGNAQTCNVYKQQSGAWGYIGVATNDGSGNFTFTDNYIIPDTSKSVPKTDSRDLFNSTDNYPTAVGYAQQRRWFAGSNNMPQRVWATQAGTQSDMSYSFPTEASDRISVQIASREASAIRHIVSLNDLLLLTGSSEWRLTGSGGSGSPIDASSGGVIASVQSFTGANEVPPLTNTNRLLFAAEKGGHIWQLRYVWQFQSFVPEDVSLLAAHLFDTYSIVDMSQTLGSVPVIWCVRSDGTLLGMTYVPMQEVIAWHHHTTSGTFESVCALHEANSYGANEDFLYVVVNRTVNGVQKRYIERVQSRLFRNAEDAFYVDCGVTQTFASPVNSFSGLDWLEGETVAILGDGAVYPDAVVSGGAVTISDAVSKVTIGLPFTTKIQTAPLAQNADPAMLKGRPLAINKVFIGVYNSGIIQAGPTFSDLTTYPSRRNEAWGTPPALLSTELMMNLTPTWLSNPQGQLCIQSSDPLPLEVTYLAMEVAIGGG